MKIETNMGIKFQKIESQKERDIDIQMERREREINSQAERKTASERDRVRDKQIDNDRDAFKKIILQIFAYRNIKFNMIAKKILNVVNHLISYAKYQLYLYNKQGG